MINILIVAPAPMMRAGLRAMLVGDGLQVVGEAGSLGDSVANGSSADVLVVADDDLLEEGVRTEAGEVAPALVVLSDEQWTMTTLSKLPLRGWAVVPVEVSSAELQAAVMAAAQGLITLPAPMVRQLLSARAPVHLSERAEGVEQLTPRELEVLQLLSDGLSNKLIARRLLISEHTVKFHVSSIYAKLGAASRADAVSRGARQGLITF